MSFQISNDTTRRLFLKRSILAGVGLSVLNLSPMEVFARHELVKLTILHTNDVHSRIDPFPANDPKYPNMGGVAPRAELIKSIRAVEPNVLLFDCGDIFQGTPYFNFYKGELEMKLMSEMGYDAGTIGNHDFDLGIEGLEKQLQHATFPLLSANYNFDNTVMKGKTKNYTVFNKGGIKVGVFGLGIELDGLVGKNMYGETQYLDPIHFANYFSMQVKFCTIDKAHFDFWRTFSISQQSGGSPFAAPINLKSNIKGDGAIGIWGGYGATYINAIAK